GPTLRLYLQNTSFPDLLYGVREEGNARLSEEIRYEKWAPPTGSNANCSYPQRCVKRGELTVVTAHRVSNPPLPDDLGVDRYSTYFSYEEPRVDFLGRGFLGFNTVRAWEPQRPIQVSTTYDNDVIDTSQPNRTTYPKASVPSRTTTVIPILDVPKDGRG